MGQGLLATQNPNVQSSTFKQSELKQSDSVDSYAQLKKETNFKDKYHVQKKDASVFDGQFGMDKTNKIESLEMVGWSHPDAGHSQKAIKWLKALDFGVDVYPKHLMDNNK